MLRRLRDSAGAWHTLAGYLPHLARAGVDSSAIESDTGIERVQQNAWLVAVQVRLPLATSAVIFAGLTNSGVLQGPVLLMQVHQSLQKSPECTKETIQYFDVEGADVLLYEPRFLSAEVRPAAATYIAANQLEPPVSPRMRRPCNCLSVKCLYFQIRTSSIQVRTR